VKKSLAFGLAVWAVVTTILVFIFFRPIEKPKEAKTIKQPTQITTQAGQSSSFWLPENGRIVFLNRLLFLEDEIKTRLIRELEIEIKKYKSRGLDFLKNDIWLSYIRKELRRAEIHPDLIYLPIIENTMDPTAVSSEGAGGNWQLMPDTATPYELKINSYIDERFDPVKSTDVAIKHILYLHNRFGDWTSTVGGYNMNPAVLEKMMKQKNTSNFYNLTIDDIPKETHRFPFRILANKLIFENPEKYGFSKADWLPENAYDNWRIIEVSLIVRADASIEKIVDEIKTDFPYLTVSDFKKFNPQIISNWLPRGNYTIYILQEHNGTS
jgi:membrane-bound lytic murein transglycosylase D